MVAEIVEVAFCVLPVKAVGVKVIFCPGLVAMLPIDGLMVQTTPEIFPLMARVELSQTGDGLATGELILFRLSTRTVAVAEHPPLVAVIVTVWFCVGAVIAAGVKVVFCPLVGDTEPALEVQFIPATPLVTATVPLVQMAPAAALMLAAL